MELEPSRVEFCLVSFEGPDRYSLAGGLGVRVTQLAAALSKRGFDTHLVFVGSPDAPGVEEQPDGRLTYYRWCQWLSAHHPQGVYDGEDDKIRDFTESLPPFLVDHIVRPAVSAGRIPVILAEEWHTADAVVRLHDLLVSAGLRQATVLLWNANNTMSFDRISWERLRAAAQLTTVSRYMKHVMWERGVNPLVIPNGIPDELLESVDPARVAELRASLDPDGAALMLFKIGRFDPAKRWIMAMEAAAMLKKRGLRVVFPISGGIEAHGAEVAARAAQLGLSMEDVHGQPQSWTATLDLLRDHPRSEIKNLHFFMPPDTLRHFYAAADGVLANSGHEPFGLVGLEAMAAGGLVFTGTTGEDFTLGGEGAIPLDTDDPDEIVMHMLDFRNEPDRARAMRSAARSQAKRFTWDRAVDVILDKVRLVARSQRTTQSLRVAPPAKRARGVVVYAVVHQPRRLRLPAMGIREGASPSAMAESLFDDPLNEKYFRKVAASCYRPALSHFEGLLDRGLKLGIGLSMSFVEQALRWDPDLLDRFRRLVRHDHVELVAVEPTHGFVLLWDTRRFIEQMKYAAQSLEELFGVRPLVADTTELMMSDTIYHALERAGFKAGFVDGRRWVLGNREPTRIFRHAGGELRLLARHHHLSDDVGYRFSDRGWDCWPLTADRYAEWLAGSPGDAVVLGWDFETFGEHHREESGIFEFLDAFPREVRGTGLSFLTPSEAVARFGDAAEDLHLPAFPSTWAGSGGLEFFLGNDVQRAVFQLMVQAYNKAMLTGNPEFVDLALWLSQSDNLHLIQWYGRSGPDAEVSAYFTPREWWSLGPDRIVSEIQKVYKSFIRALDEHIPRSEGGQRQIPDTPASNDQTAPHSPEPARSQRNRVVTTP